MPQKAVFLTIDGITKRRDEWSKQYRVPVGTIRSRMQLGWDAKSAVTTPPDRRFRAGGSHTKAAPRPCPRLKRHRATGQAYVEWEFTGERNIRYFGRFDSDEANQAYARFQLEWATRVARPAPVAPGEVVHVCELVELRLAHCDAWYVKDGKPTSEVYAHHSATAYLVELYGATPVPEFGPDDLRAVRDAMVKAELTRRTVNGYLTRLKQMFEWGVGKKLVPADVWLALQPVERLQRGKTAAKDNPKKRAVGWPTVEAVFPHLHWHAGRRAVLETMVRLHWLLGCRPQDLVGMKPGEIDRTGDVWHFVPRTHKNEHREQELDYWIGPKAQAILGPMLDGCPDDRLAFLYPPRYAKGRAVRITRHEYGRRVNAACVAAGVTPWTPHQLRHSRATEVMHAYESNAAAAAAIGDSEEVTREVYVDPLTKVKRRIARELG